MDDNRQSSHHIYEVIEGEGEEGKDKWNKIGAAWPNKDGKGYSLDIEGKRLVMRVPFPKRGESGDDEAT